MYLKEWENTHSGYLDDEKLRKEWHGLVEAMCRPSSGPEGDKIKKNLSKMAPISKKDKTKWHYKKASWSNN